MTYIPSTQAARALAPPAYISGQYYVCNSETATSTSATMGNNNLRVSPWVVTQPLSITKLFAEHTANTADSGAVLRIGIYADNGTQQPGALILDAGTLDMTAAAAVQEVTVNKALAPGLYWAGGALQNVSTQPTLRTVSNTGIGVPQLQPLGSSLPSADARRITYLHNGTVSGALPDPFVVSAVGAGNSNACVRIGFKVA